MSFPIPVRMTVAESNIPVNMTVAENAVSYGMTLDTKIVASFDEYEGPYTVSPSEQVKTLDTDGKMMAQDVTVNAIPSSYVGTGIERRTQASLTANGAIVTAPAGYYDSSASKSIANATTASASSVTVNPTLAVNYETGEITANNSQTFSVSPISVEGYARNNITHSVSVSGNVGTQLYTLGSTTYTPSTVAQTISAGKYLTGDQVISPIPSQYHDMSGPLGWMGVDAELVDTFTLSDVKLSATAYNGWTPSTTAKDILATRNAGTFAASDMVENEYMLVWETVIPVVMQSGATQKALPVYLASTQVQSICRRPSSYANILSDVANNNVCVTAWSDGNFLRYYGTTQGTITYTLSASYGFYATLTAATFSSTTAGSPTVTLKTPKVTARCSTTYMSTGNAALVDQEKTIIKQKCYVYRIKKKGFVRGIYDRMFDLVKEVDA